MQVDELQGLIDSSPVHRRLEIQVASAEGSSLTFTARLDASSVATTGIDIVHGGVVATLLDVAATFALIAFASEDWATVDLRMDFLRPLPTGVVLALGKAEHVGRRLGRASASLTDASSSVEYARAIGTFIRSGVTLREGT